MTTQQQADLEIKAFGEIEIKSADKGEVEAIIATIGVVDRDEDIITAGAIANGSKVSMSSYGHDAIYGNRPIGKGMVVVEGNKAIFKGRVFLNTEAGRDTFEVLKEMGGDQQWSFGFRILGSEVPSDDQRKEGARRILTKLDAFEVSPVIRGAGVDTRTLAVKSATEPPPPDPAIEAARLEAEQKAAAVPDVALELRLRRAREQIATRR